MSNPVIPEAVDRPTQAEQFGPGTCRRRPGQSRWAPGACRCWECEDDREASR